MKKMKKPFAIMLALIMVLAFIPAAATTAATSGTDEAPGQTTYTLDVSKTVEGLPEADRPSSITVSLMQAGINTPVSSASLEWDEQSKEYSGQLTDIPEGEYTIEESGANVEGYTYEMQAFVPVVGELSVELEPSASLVSNPSPSTSPEPVLLQSNRIKVTANGELILKNTYTKTESDPETVTISIPIYKEVRQGGNTAPGEQTFTFVLSDFGVDDLAPQVKVENNTIKTNGAGHYETVMTVTVTIDKKNFGNLLEGFKVTERNDGAPYWAYDATEWYVMPQQDNEDKITGCIFYTAGDQTPYKGISFTNIYTYNYNGGYYPAPVRPVQPAPLPPQTGDMPLWYAVAQFLGLVK